MSNSKYIFIRMTETQHERVRNNAEAKGFKTISSYIRSITLEHDLSSQKKIDEMHFKITNGEARDKKDNIDEKLTNFL